jgi:nicotinamidase/pyrazinamidase
MYDMSNYLPAFYKPSLVGKSYNARTAEVMTAGANAGWSAASRDGKKVALLVVDGQVSFCHEDGELAVPGALDDARRLIDLIFRQGHAISSISLTVDTHFPYMIFFSSWWRAGKNFTDPATGVSYKRNDQPVPFTVISEDSIRRGLWQAAFDPAWSHAYPTKLAQSNKYQLMIWPYHTMDTTQGISVLPPLYEAVVYHGAARYTQPTIIHKGHIPQTEFYSPLKPEVEVPNVPGASLNTHVLQILAKNDLILVAGWAKSHCVLSGMETLVEYFGSYDPKVLQRILFLEDCTSSVKHPTIDFDAIADEKLEVMRKKHGIKLVKSTQISL